MATWHQMQADKRAPSPLWHNTEWTVVIDPPNDMRALVRFSTKALADAYMRGLKDNNPRAFRHSCILKPAGRM